MGPPRPDRPRHGPHHVNGSNSNDRRPHPPPRSTSSTTNNNDNHITSPQTPTTNSKIGPHPGHIKSSDQYTPDLTIRLLLSSHNNDPAREASNRLQGVQLLDNVRQQLQLPVRTFDTACVYFHRFRLGFRDAEYNYQDAALASLFVACKVEDTIKKSKEILAAAYNVKNPDKPVAPDDKIFESPGKVIIGLERLILETIGFDFRTRYPQKLLVKVVHQLFPPSSSNATPEEARAFFDMAYAMSIDMYKTFIPIKRTTFAMVMALVELTALLLNGGENNKDGSGNNAMLDAVRAFAAEKRVNYARPAVMETMLDLLDLYVQHPKSTKIGTRFDIALFMDIKIQLNQDLDHDSIPRHVAPRICPRCEDTPTIEKSNNPTVTTPGSTSGAGGSITSPTASFGVAPRPPRGQDGTMRFVFDPEAASEERNSVGEYFREEFEEYEVEVDEPIPPPPQHPSSRRDDHEGGRGGGRGGRRHRDRWGGGHGGGYRGDRPRGRGRHR